MLKNIDPEELAETIRSAAEGEAVLDSKVASRLMHEYRDDANEVHAGLYAVDQPRAGGSAGVDRQGFIQRADCRATRDQ